MYNGRPFLADSHANALYMLNEEYLFLAPHKDENMRFEPFQKPIQQNVRVAKIFWMGALVSDNNRRHGKLAAITA